MRFTTEGTDASRTENHQKVSVRSVISGVNFQAVGILV